MKFGNFCGKNVLYTLLSEKIKMLFSELTCSLSSPGSSGEQRWVSRWINAMVNSDQEQKLCGERERESSQLRGGSGARHMVEQLLSARDHSDRSNSIF